MSLGEQFVERASNGDSSGAQAILTECRQLVIQRLTKEGVETTQELLDRAIARGVKNAQNYQPESEPLAEWLLALARDVAKRSSPTKKPRWNKADVDRLRELYPARSNLEIANMMQRSVKSIVSKAHHMGLKKDPARLSEMGRQNVRRRHDRQGKPDGDAPS